MPKFETLSQNIFDERARTAISKTPIRKEISIKDVERHHVEVGRPSDQNE